MSDREELARRAEAYMDEMAAGLPFRKLAPRIDAGIIVLCFEDGDTETVAGTEIMGAVELYGDMYVTKVTPFSNIKWRNGKLSEPEIKIGCEVQLSNQAEAGRK